MIDIPASVLFEGDAGGEVLVLDEPLSFWGGVDRESGVIIDVHHPQRGQLVTGKVVVMAVGRGSSSSSSVFAELIRLSIAPAAVVLTEFDPILVLGAIVGDLLYARRCPFVRIDPADVHRMATGQFARIDAAGLHVTGFD